MSDQLQTLSSLSLWDFILRTDQPQSESLARFKMYPDVLFGENIFQLLRNSINMWNENVFAFVLLPALGIFFTFPVVKKAQLEYPHLKLLFLFHPFCILGGTCSDGVEF